MKTKPVILTSQVEMNRGGRVGWLIGLPMELAG
jgi:hypothetical protein